MIAQSFFDSILPINFSYEIFKMGSELAVCTKWLFCALSAQKQVQMQTAFTFNQVTQQKVLAKGRFYLIFGELFYIEEAPIHCGKALTSVSLK